MLEATIRKYQNRTFEAAQVNAELIGLWLAFSGHADAVEALRSIRGLRVGELKMAGADGRFHGGTEVGPGAGRQDHVGAGQHREPRPANGGSGLGGIDFNLGKNFWPTKPEGIPLPGKNYVVEVDLIVFKTDIRHSTRGVRMVKATKFFGSGL
jgi:hypothetical protein